METTLTSPSASRPSAARLLAIVAAFGLALAQLPAQAQIYLCVDASGTRELTDRYKPGCKSLDIASSIPAPSGGARRASAPPRAAAPAATPSDFPRVDTSQQRARDNDRREILLEEMRAEEKRLQDLKTEFKGGEPDRLGSERNYAKYLERVANLREAIGRSEKNIEALQREIAAIK
ncbi:DUF4124 domain-containing protein [Massilia sp. PAMC28688]|uniref:DUF4124 domain-containing protein n=1 Tax=Massilia sp. PAMC28688 TaxID=2861283 RepID=UPI001C63A119|nr:DUF4124 domain-containing protein [Massilia sp. PAMC28688]QYF94253.1 DUF4124 domain-containing protein [Massilia sp. PAMC28688]